MHFSLYKGWNFKDTVERFDIETLFIIIKVREVIYIFTVLKLYMTGLWRFVLLH